MTNHIFALLRNYNYINAVTRQSIENDMAPFGKGMNNLV